MLERYRILRNFAKAEVKEEVTFQNVVSEYYVAEPFIKVVIYEDPEERKLRYHVVEPFLSAEEAKILSSLISDLRRVLSLQIFLWILKIEQKTS
jgi:hypothetical protein